MDLGVVLMVGSAGMTSPELGRADEERSLDSLFCAEHTHIPVGSTRTDGRRVRPYADAFDPFVALSAAQLHVHFAAGRLTPDELDDRLTAVLAARTFGDLHRPLAACASRKVPVIVPAYAYQRRTCNRYCYARLMFPAGGAIRPIANVATTGVLAR